MDHEPLGLTSMGFHPLERHSKSSIAPTENDKIFRECVVRGNVHDPGAHMMGEFVAMQDYSVMLETQLD